MAFDQPLAADHVDFGDNILISLVTRPILGSLCWILGDNSDNKKSSSSSSKLMTDDDHVALQSGLEAMVLDDHNDDDTEVLRNTSTNSEHSSWNYDDADHHHHLPRMIRSDVSVAEQQPASLLPRRSSFTDLMIENVQENHNEHLQQGKKKMSWSENLVEYMDDESMRHEPPTTDSPMTMTMPQSAMRRSVSTRSHSMTYGMTQSAGSDDTERKSRYLPSGLDKAHHGSLRMPTRPGLDYHSTFGGGSARTSHGSASRVPGVAGSAGNGAGGGIDSPQWGWYINTTPPTPEMYHSRSSLTKSSSNGSSANDPYGSPSLLTTAGMPTYDASIPAARGPNRVFQGLKAGSNRPTVGWPSVPL